MRRLRTRLGELDCQVLDEIPEGGKPDLAVVLCHGFGAPAGDLVPLAEELLALRPELGPRVRFVFPAAPHSLADMGMPGGLAWFPIPLEVMMGRQRDWQAYSSA